MPTMTSRKESAKTVKSRMMFHHSHENVNTLRPNPSHTENLQNKMQLPHYNLKSKCRIKFFSNQKERVDMTSRIKEKEETMKLFHYSKESTKTVRSRSRCTRNIKSRLMFHHSYENVNTLQPNPSHTENLQNKMQLPHYSHKSKSCRTKFFNSQKQRADLISLKSFNYSSHERRK